MYAVDKERYALIITTVCFITLLINRYRLPLLGSFSSFQMQFTSSWILLLQYILVYGNDNNKSKICTEKSYAN
jgi:hypothetical protein